MVRHHRRARPGPCRSEGLQTRITGRYSRLYIAGRFVAVWPPCAPTPHYPHHPAANPQQCPKRKRRVSTVSLAATIAPACPTPARSPGPQAKRADPWRLAGKTRTANTSPPRPAAKRFPNPLSPPREFEKGERTEAPAPSARQPFKAAQNENFPTPSNRPCAIHPPPRPHGVRD